MQFTDWIASPGKRLQGLLALVDEPGITLCLVRGRATIRGYCQLLFSSASSRPIS